MFLIQIKYIIYKQTQYKTINLNNNNENIYIDIFYIVFTSRLFIVRLFCCGTYQFVNYFKINLSLLFQIQESVLLKICIYMFNIMFNNYNSYNINKICASGEIALKCCREFVKLKLRNCLLSNIHNFARVSRMLHSASNECS